MRDVQAAALIFLTLAIFLDVLSLYLALRRNRQGYGASGIPLMSWWIYLAYCGLIVKASTIQTLIYLLLLTLFHLSCQYVVPALHHRFFARAPQPEVSSTEERAADDDPFNPFPEPVTLEIRDVRDLHTLRPRDVGPAVEEYLYQARLAGFRHVRIIHGKGIGVQRETVRAILARTPFVEHYADAPADAGGWGATLARLSAGGA